MRSELSAISSKHLAHNSIISILNLLKDETSIKGDKEPLNSKITEFLESVIAASNNLFQDAPQIQHPREINWSKILQEVSLSDLDKAYDGSVADYLTRQVTKFDGSSPDHIIFDKLPESLAPIVEACVNYKSLCRLVKDSESLIPESSYDNIFRSIMKGTNGVLHMSTLHPLNNNYPIANARTDALRLTWMVLTSRANSMQRQADGSQVFNREHFLEIIQPNLGEYKDLLENIITGSNNLDLGLALFCGLFEGGILKGNEKYFEHLVDCLDGNINDEMLAAIKNDTGIGIDPNKKCCSAWKLAAANQYDKGQDKEAIDYDRLLREKFKAAIDFRLIICDTTKANNSGPRVRLFARNGCSVDEINARINQP